MKNVTVFIVYDLNTRDLIGLAHSLSGAKDIAERHHEAGEQVEELRETLIATVSIGSAS